MKYLIVFDDGAFKQVDELAEGDADSVTEGYMDVIRFENGQFQRWLPGEQPEWVEV